MVSCRGSCSFRLQRGEKPCVRGIFTSPDALAAEGGGGPDDGVRNAPVSSPTVSNYPSDKGKGGFIIVRVNVPGLLGPQCSKRLEALSKPIESHWSLRMLAKRLGSLEIEVNLP